MSTFPAGTPVGTEQEPASGATVVPGGAEPADAGAPSSDSRISGGAAVLIGELLGIASLVLFAANVLVVGEASRRGNYDHGFLVALGVNTVVAAGIVGIEAGLGGLGSWDLPALLYFFLGGVFSTYLGRLTFWVTVVGMGPSRAATFQITQPLFASLLALLFLGQGLTLTETGLMLVALAGLWVVNRSRQTAPARRPGPGTAPAAPAATAPAATAPARRRVAVRTRTTGWRQHLVLVAVASGLAYGAANVFRGAAIARYNEPFVGSFLGAFAGLVCYLAFHIRPGAVLALLRGLDRRALWLFCASGLLSILAQTAAIASLRYLPVAIANMFSVSVPIVVVPVSVLLLGNREGVNRLTAVGVLLTWSAVVGLIVL